MSRSTLESTHLTYSRVNINYNQFYTAMDMNSVDMAELLFREEMVANFFHGLSKPMQTKALAAFKKIPRSAACQLMARKVGGVYHGFQLQPDGHHRLNNDECNYAPAVISKYIDAMRVTVNAKYNSLKAETAQAPTDTAVEKLVRAYVLHHWFKHVQVVLGVDTRAVGLVCVETLYRDSVLAEHSVFAGHGTFEHYFGQGEMCPNYSDHTELFSDIRDIVVVYSEEMMNSAPGLRSVQGRTYQPCPNMSDWTPFTMTTRALLSEDEARVAFRLLWRHPVPEFWISYHKQVVPSFGSSVSDGEMSSQLTRVVGLVGPVGTHGPLAGMNVRGSVVSLELLGHLSYCTYCYETSHTRRQCVKQTCARCNTVGHYAKDCVN